MSMVSMRKVLLIVAFFMLASGAWLAVMELVLRHSGYAGRFAIAVCIGGISAMTILAHTFRARIRVERALWVGAAALIWIGTQAFVRNARAAHFEGYVAVIALTIVFQGVLMLTTMGRRKGLVDAPVGLTPAQR